MSVFMNKEYQDRFATCNIRQLSERLLLKSEFNEPSQENPQKSQLSHALEDHESFEHGSKSD